MRSPLVRRWLANPRNRQRLALGGCVVVGVVAAGTAGVQQTLSAGSAAYGWSFIGYVLAVACGVAVVTWETGAALAVVDFAPVAASRRAKLLLASGCMVAMTGCLAGVAMAKGHVLSATLVGVVAGGLAAAAGGAVSLMATRGADYAARKVDERTRDEW